MTTQRDIEDLGPDARAVRQAYEQLPRREPPAQLDRRIRAAAAAAAGRRRPAWVAPVALAATVLLSFGLVMRLALPPDEARRRDARGPSAALQVEQEAADASGSARQAARNMAPSLPERHREELEIDQTSAAAPPASETRSVPPAVPPAPAANTASGNRLPDDAPFADADAVTAAAPFEQASAPQRTQTADAAAAEQPGRASAVFGSQPDEQPPAVPKSEAAAFRMTRSDVAGPAGCTLAERRAAADWISCMRVLKDAGDDALAAEIELWETQRPGELLPADLRETP